MQVKIGQIQGLQAALDTRATTFANVGSTGVGVYSSKSGSTVNFNKIVAGNGILPLVIFNNVITIGVDTGADPNSIVQLDDTAALPQVDAHNLFNINASNMGSGTIPLSNMSLNTNQFYVGGAGNHPVSTAKTSIPLSGFGVPTANVDIGAFKITTSASVWNQDELVPRSYVDAVAQGTVYKAAARAATNSNVNLASPGAAIGGVTLSMSDRVFVKDQTLGAQNGVYLWNGATNPMTRTTDCDTDTELNNMAIYVQEGDHAGESWRIVTALPITVDTTVLVYTQIQSATQYTATNGVKKTGSVLSFDGDTITLGIVSAKAAVISSSTAGQVLLSSGTAGATAAWGALNLGTAAAVTGVLPFARGGNGVGTLAQHSFLASISAADGLSALTLSTNTVAGRKNGNIQAMAKTDLREITNLRLTVEKANATANNMTLITLAHAPDDPTLMLLWYNGALLTYTTDYTISGSVVTATSALNVQFGGTSSDGAGFSSSDQVAVFYWY